jgi:hypothetical protein
MWRALFLVLASARLAGAQDTSVPPELKALEGRYDQARLAKDEALREKYITELTDLRWKLVHDHQDGWVAVDAEVARHPAPAEADPAALAKLITGDWHSPREDYRYSADGTWTMLPADPGTTHGKWSIQGNQFIESAEGETAPPPETIILLDHDLFITTQGTDVFYEKRSLAGGPSLRREE